MIAASWRERWTYITPFLSLPADLRRAVYTTNSIENLNRQIRKSIKTRGHFPDEQAATKLIYLAILRAEGNGGKHTTGQQHYEASRSTSETDSQTDQQPTPDLTHRRSDTLRSAPRA